MSVQRQPTKRDDASLSAPEQTELLPKGQRSRDPFADVASERRTARRRAVASKPYSSKDVPRGGRHARRQERTTGHFLGALVMHLLAIVFRLAALALCAVVVAGSFAFAAARLRLTWMVNFVNPLVPDALSGLLVYQTPFGGAFRGDFAIAAFVLFVLDWLCMKASARLR